MVALGLNCTRGLPDRTHCGCVLFWHPNRCTYALVSIDTCRR